MPAEFVETDGHISSRVIVEAGKDIVVDVDRVHGGKTKVHGGRQVTVGEAEEYMSGEIETTPEPSPTDSPPT